MALYHPRRPTGLIYDDGLALPQSLSPIQLDAAIVQWGADASVLYSSAYSSQDDLGVMSVTSSGVTLNHDYNNLFFGGFHFDANTGYIYTDSGRVLDRLLDLIGTFQTFPLGVFQGWNFLTYGTLCAPDTQNGLVYFVGASWMQRFAVAGLTVEAFNAKTYQLVASVAIPGAMINPTNFVRWGRAGLAISTSNSGIGGTTSGSIYVVDGSFVSTTQAPDTVLGTPAPAPQYRRRKPAKCGGGFRRSYSDGNWD